MSARQRQSYSSLLIDRQFWPSRLIAMGFIEELLAGFATALVVGPITWLIPRRVKTWRGFRAVLRGRKRLRVSMSALLRIEDEGRFLLLRQGPHRPNQLGPIGGVYKIIGPGVPIDLDFQNLSLADEVRSRDISDDLRGTIPAFRLPQFLRWFDSRAGRESDALHRELHEELVDDGPLDELPDGLFPLRCELLHIAEEGPTTVRQGDPVYRRHEIYRLHRGAADLLALAEKHDSLQAVSADEIRKGRTTDGIDIGDQTLFLLSPRALRGARHF